MPSTAWKCQIIDNKDQDTSHWNVEDPKVLNQMIDHCRTASPWTQTFDIDEREGYNGVKFFNDEETYTAFMGKLIHTTGSTTETKTDLGRKLEKLVLFSAPEPFRKKALAVLTIDFD